MKHRGFAMPMVLALVVVVGMMSAVMLERQGAQRLITQRQLTWYKEHHARLGLQEGIEAWIKSLPSNADLRSILPVDGHFLDLKLRGRSSASITLLEQQHAVLIDLAAVDANLLDAAAAIAAAVAQTYGKDGPPEDGLRTVGPPQFSTHSTSEDLIALAVEAVTGDRNVGEAFARSIAGDREDNGGSSSAGAVGMAIADAGIESDMRAVISRLFTVRPTLYYAVVELRDSTIGPPVARYGGYFSIAANRDPSSTDRSAFLTWENLGVE
jgi:hypothetical protein